MLYFMKMIKEVRKMLKVTIEGNVPKICDVPKDRLIKSIAEEVRRRLELTPKDKVIIKMNFV